jgi:hypothetical protein
MRSRRHASSFLVAFAALLVVTLALPRMVDAAPVSNHVASMTSRDACKAALAHERAGEPTVPSRGPCHSAFLVGGQPEDLRGEVASLMSPATRTTLDDVAIGSLMADAALRQATDQPWGYLARCDIAERTGNADTLEACLEDLRRIAPNHPATKWSLAATVERPSGWVWTFRGLLLLTLLGTLAHAIFGMRARRRLERRVAPLVAATLLGTFFLCGPSARAADTAALPKDHLSDFAIDDANPEGSVPAVELQTKKPLEFGYFLQDLAAKAEKASGRGDHAAAARYYGALAKAAPTVAYGPRQMCVELEAAGDVATAIKACRTAVTGLGSTAADFIRFVSLVLASRGPQPPAERQELDAVISHLRRETQLGALPTMLRCQVDLRFKDYPALEACTSELGRLAPNDPKTLSLQWALALEQNDHAAALALVDRARGTGMSSDGIAKMEAGTRALGRRRLGRFALLTAIVVLMAAGIALGIRRLSTRRQATI